MHRMCWQRTSTNFKRDNILLLENTEAKRMNALMMLSTQ
jgi:hypothetical protein